ncbi:lecithin retinol acyltransferase family protein [Rufibacter quisquiliarum]|nr:lecithin retinol acyltransferase family protein [Rufibacter quisquiliarum]
MEMIRIHLKANIMHPDKIIAKQLGLTPGDTIIAPKSDFDIIQHHAIYLGEDHYGNHFVCENAYGRGVVMSSLSKFINKYPRLTKIKKLNEPYHRRTAIVRSALSKLGKPYDLINYNCEHFVNDVVSNKPSSRQIANAFGLIGLALAINFISKSR